MSNTSRPLDPVWEQEIYSQGRHLNRYPFDSVVTFVFRNYPRAKARAQVRILEVGCGSANNLWFAAREGFAVSGLDGSPSAIAAARERFASEGLAGDFHVGDFTRLPFEADRFDLVIDRAALTCCGRTAVLAAVAEIRRVLVPGGRCFFNPYAEGHSSLAASLPGPDGVRVEIHGGTLVDVGQIRFYGRSDVEELFGEGWQLLSLQLMEMREELKPEYTIHAEWRVTAEKR
jgi:SAM-dependent methyltransferase